MAKVAAPSKEPEKPELRLLGKDGNAFAIMAAARRVAQQNDMDWHKIQREAQMGDYDHLMRTMMKYFEVV